jgi:DNA-binding beta-propeller fold protein YncE
MSGDEAQARVVIGGQLYSIVRDWAPLPQGVPPGRISTLSVDSSGRLYVLRRGANPPVLVYGPDGGLVASFGDGLIFDAHGIAIDVEDRVFVVDRDAHQVICFSPDGAVLFALGDRHMPHWDAPFNHPTDVAVAPDGAIYVSDGYGNGNVHAFSPDGSHRFSFGAVGRGRGEFMTPHALLVDRQGRIVVADRENNRVQLFDRDGGWLGEYGGLCRPMDVFERADGALLVTDIVPSLNAFAPDGTRIGRGRPSLNGAHGITGDRAGRLYLAEIDPNSITLLRPV